jgi:hypothetical protein
MMSFVPPGGKPTIMRTGRAGKPCGSCAAASVPAPSNVNAAGKAACHVFIMLLL